MKGTEAATCGCSHALLLYSRAEVRADSLVVYQRCQLPQRAVHNCHMAAHNCHSARKLAGRKVAGPVTQGWPQSCTSAAHLDSSEEEHGAKRRHGQLVGQRLAQRCAGASRARRDERLRRWHQGRREVQRWWSGGAAESCCMEWLLLLTA